MRFLKVFGFIWICFDTTFYIGLRTYPINYNEYPALTTLPSATLMNAGIIFGFSMVYFYSGFATMYDILQSIYVRQQDFSTLLFFIRCYIFYVIPVAFTTAIMVAVFPFIGGGPLYSKITQEMFLDSCSQYWWTNILLISNFYPAKFSDQCGNNLTYIANEFQMMVILIPLFVLVYKNAYRNVLIGALFVVGICGSLIPTFVLTLQNNINGYPGYLSNGYDLLFMKIYYRIPPFLMGIALGIIKFEYKYVGTLNDGTYPVHKALIDKLKHKKHCKMIAYISGVLLSTLSVVILFTDTACVDKSPLPDMVYKEMSYCWSPLASAFYNSFGQFFFFSGMILILTPSLVHASNILRPLMDSHLWHVLEELTLSAYLLQLIVVTWYFASRQQDSLLSMSNLFMITISSCILSYIVSIPFYLLVERPFKNFLDLILFPKSSIFKRTKDIEDDEDEDEDDTQNQDEMETDELKGPTEEAEDDYQMQTEQT